MPPPTSSDESISALIAGVARFQREVYPLGQAVNQQAACAGRHPHALFVTCCDFGMAPELITQSEPGEILVIRSAGNLIPPYRKRYDSVSAMIEYAVIQLRVNHIVVCGHSHCGAVAGLLQPQLMERLPLMKSWLRNGQAALRTVRNKSIATDEACLLEELTRENVLLQMYNLRTHPSVAGRLADGSLGISGWVYESGQGTVRGFDKEQRMFVPVGSERNVPPPDSGSSDNQEFAVQTGTT